MGANAWSDLYHLCKYFRSALTDFNIFITLIRVTVNVSPKNVGQASSETHDGEEFKLEYVNGNALIRLLSLIIVWLALMCVGFYVNEGVKRKGRTEKIEGRVKYAKGGYE